MRESIRGIASILASGWRVSPGRMTASFVVLLLNYVSRPVAAVALQRVTDAVVRHDARAAAFAAAVLPAIALVTVTGGRIAQVLWVELSDLNLVRLGEELGELSQGPRGLEHHERADYADRLELLRNESKELYRSVQLALNAIALAVQIGITVLLLARLQPALVLLLLFGVPPLLAMRWSFQRLERARLATADRARLAAHLLELAVRADAAREIRVFGTQDELRRRLRETRRSLGAALHRARVEGVALLAAAQLLFAVGFVGGLLLVVRGAVDGHHSVGDVVLVVTLAVQTNSIVFESVFLTQWLQRSVRAVTRLRWLRELVAALYPPAPTDEPVPETIHRGIRLERVSFRYPGTDAEVLREVDLSLPAGGTVAFVGENGAGKSTLVKLLCRFYDPTSGCITVDGRDLARFPVDAWRSRIAAGFQDFVRFELLARESVGIGDLAAIDEEDAVVAALERAAARDLVQGLSGGLETPLGKSHSDGVELSGGQWQKIGLARAMMRARPLLLILDEPTSALDAHAEHVLFERYSASARAVARATGGIAIFVSHRFSTVRMADLIVVLDGGRIVEQGTHEELTRRGGMYSELFALQAAAYG